MQNIEFKAELRDLEAARCQCRLAGAIYIGRLYQTDTYYKLPDGRLKRREAIDEPTEWIFYHRDDHVRPRVSNYSILTDEQARRRWGTYSLREWLQVRKIRELWMLDNVRIHLDDVESLGTFIEFEAVVGTGHDTAACQAAVGRLRAMFGAVLGEAVSVSYSDLMDEQVQSNRDAT